MTTFHPPEVIGHSTDTQVGEKINCRTKELHGD